MSLTEVFPTDPVMPTTGTWKEKRAALPSWVKAVVVFSTLMDVPSLGSCSVKYAAAPSERASSI